MKHVIRLAGLSVGSMFLATSLFAVSPGVQLVDAVKNSDRAAIRELLAKHVDVSATETDGSTALAWAVRRARVMPVRDGLAEPAV